MLGRNARGNAGENAGENAGRNIEKNARGNGRVCYANSHKVAAATRAAPLGPGAAAPTDPRP